MRRIIQPFKEALKFISAIVEKRYLIYELSKRDFKARYMGTYLGLFWSFLQPLLMTFIMWFVFSFGFKIGSGPGGISFIAYLLTGMLAWNYFSDAFSSSTRVIIEYSFLVKKINFRVSILPIVKLITAVLTHLLFFIIVVIVLISQGIYPSIYWLQFLYYLFCMIVLTLGLSWITSSISVFARDMAYFVSIAVQFGFWLTPVFWDSSILPPKWGIIVKINPMAYVVNGYRNSFLYNQSFWKDDLFSIVWFWAIAIFFLLVGIVIFRRLRPHFADVI